MAKSAKAVVTTSEAELMVPSDLIESARRHFGTMQRSWWDFAKAIHFIREGKAYEEAGFETFKDFVVAEYPSVDYTVMLKFCSIVKEWGKSIEQRLEKEPDYQLPAYESCYRVITAKDAPKEEITKLKKGVLDGKLSYASLKERLKEITSRVRGRVRDEVEHSVDEIEEQLSKEIEGDLEGEFDDFESEDTLMDSAGEVEDFDDDEGIISIAPIKAKITYLNDNLPDLASKIESMEVNESLVELAQSLEKLYENIDSVLGKIEEKCSE